MKACYKRKMETSLLKNYLTFNSVSVQNISRKDCFISKTPYTKACRDIAFKKIPDAGIGARTNVFDLKCIPSNKQLTQWSTELARRHRISSTEFYVECDIGNLTYEDINLLKLLRSASQYKDAFSQELAWFNSAPLRPYSIKPENLPNEDSISRFKKLLWEYPANLDLTDHNIGMSPNTLGNLLL